MTTTGWRCIACGCFATGKWRPGYPCPACWAGGEPWMQWTNRIDAAYQYMMRLLPKGRTLDDAITEIREKPHYWSFTTEATARMAGLLALKWGDVDRQKLLDSRAQARFNALFEKGPTPATKTKENN